MRWPAAFSACLSLLFWSGMACAGTPGLYRADEGPELAAELLLRADGSYAYALAYGALDEASQGRWREQDGTITFVTEPRPVAPEFRQESDAAAGPDVPFLLVAWPDGSGIAGIDFRIGFDAGDPIEGYTQFDGWQWPAQETRIPRWIELAEPIHAVASPRFAVAPGSRTMRFVLVPNDLGMIDLTGASATRDGDRLLLQRREGTMKFVKARR